MFVLTTRSARTLHVLPSPTSATVLSSEETRRFHENDEDPGRSILKAFLIICGAVILLAVVVSWATIATGDSSHKRHQPAQAAAVRSTATVPKQSESINPCLAFVARA